jgi:hypothetical protein
LPFLGVFIYLIARGGTMQERALKLAGLRDCGTISDLEFEQAKSRLLAQGDAQAAQKPPD